MMAYRWGRGALALVIGLAAVGPSAAQQRRPPLEARPFAGIYIPAGGQRDVVNDALVVGIQGGMRIESVTLTSTFTYARTDNRRAGATEAINIYQLDWGIERALGPPRAPGGWRPLGGAGFGVRVYDSREPDADPRRSLFAFVAGGLVRESRRAAPRLEVRAQGSRYAGVGARESASFRVDLTATIGLVLAIP